MTSSLSSPLISKSLIWFSRLQWSEIADFKFSFSPLCELGCSLFYRCSIGFSSDEHGVSKWYRFLVPPGISTYSCLVLELLRASTLWCRGWEKLLLIDVSLANILLSATYSMESRLQPRTEPALFNSLLSLFLFVCAGYPQNTTEWK